MFVKYFICDFTNTVTAFHMLSLHCTLLQLLSVLCNVEHIASSSLAFANVLQSTHPMRGETLDMGINLQKQIISIHSPHAG